MISTNAFKIQTTAGCFVNFVQEMIKWEFCHNETNLYGKKRGFDWWMDWCENLVCTYIDRFVIPSSLWRDSNNSSVTILELIWVKFGFFNVPGSHYLLWKVVAWRSTWMLILHSTVCAVGERKQCCQMLNVHLAPFSPGQRVEQWTKLKIAADLLTS